MRFFAILALVALFVLAVLTEANARKGSDVTLEKDNVTLEKDDNVTRERDGLRYGKCKTDHDCGTGRVCRGRVCTSRG